MIFWVAPAVPLGSPKVSWREEPVVAEVTVAGFDVTEATARFQVRVRVFNCWVLVCGGRVAVFRDRASGLRESRPGLDRLLKRAAAGEFTQVRVTHRDRLARFGAAWLNGSLCEGD